MENVDKLQEDLKLRPQGGGVRGSKIKLSYSERSRLDEKYAKDQIKNIIPSRSYDVLKIAICL